MQGRVRLSVGLPPILAFSFCIGIRPFLKGISETRYGRFDCDYLVPKLLNTVEKFSQNDVCTANSYLWTALAAFFFAYMSAIVFALTYNFRNFTFVVLKAPLKELALFFSFLLVPGAIGMHAFVTGDLHLKIYGGAPEAYPFATDYANAQINMLMYAVNLLFFVPSAVIPAVFIRREGKPR